MSLLHGGHWVYEDYTQRMTTKEWKIILLNESDKIIFLGLLRQLKGKRLGSGVVEIYKEPKKK